MKDKLINLLIGFIFCLALFALLGSTNNSDVGRYQITMAEGIGHSHAFIIDTTSGAVVQVRIRGELVTTNEYFSSEQIREYLNK